MLLRASMTPLRSTSIFFAQACTGQMQVPVTKTIYTDKYNEVPVDKIVYTDKIKEVPVETKTENHQEELITVKKVREVPTEKKVSRVTNFKEVVTEKTYFRDEFKQVPVEKVIL